jgi:hypothetical protein
VTGTPAISVDTFNGAIEVAAGAAGTVEVSWVRRGSSSESVEAARADIENVLVDVVSTPEAVRVTAKRKDGRPADSSGATFRLRVPPRSPVTLASSNGALTVTGLGATVSAQGSNGRITVTDGKGSLTLATSNGAVEASGETVVLDARTSNGSVSFSGSLADGAHRARSSNGSVTVTLPKDAVFDLDAKTSNGSVTSEFPLTVTSLEKRDALRGSVAAGAKVSLALETSNGSIRVRRAP